MNALYRTPDALRNALTSIARKTAKQHGTSPSNLVERFYYQRFIARVFHHDPEGWMLKGGQALLVRCEGARHSRDIDLYRLHAADDVDLAVKALREAAAHDLDDHLTFTVATVAPVAGDKGVRAKIVGTLGTKTCAQFSIDLVTGCEPLGTPLEVPLEPALPLPSPADWPAVRLYPLHDHIADKISAMYEKHRAGEKLVASSRYRDLADLLMIAQQHHVEADAALASLRHEENRRRLAGTEIALPLRYTVPDPATWTAQYPKAAKDVPGLVGCRTLDEAHPLADAFLTPLLAGTAQGTWDPTRATWNTPAPDTF